MMTDLTKKIDELADIKKQQAKLKERQSTIEAEITKQATSDLENTKYKSIYYAAASAGIKATNAESLKIVYSSFLPQIFGGAYKDAVTEKQDYKVSTPVARMMIGLWKGNYIKATIADVVNQMNGVTDDDRKQLIKKLKGINYDTDVKNILKFSNLNEEDAKEYAYMISEAAVWQNFCSLLTLNDITDETEIDSILQKIQSAFVVEDSTKIQLEEY